MHVWLTLYIIFNFHMCLCVLKTEMKSVSPAYVTHVTTACNYRNSETSQLSR